MKQLFVIYLLVSPLEDQYDDDVEFTGGQDSSAHVTVQPRWTTRVFAAICLRKIISECCDGDRAHFDLGLAREVSSMSRDFLVLHLSELVRMCFMASTSDTDQLRLEGLLAMQVVIDKFAATEEPEFPGRYRMSQKKFSRYFGSGMLVRSLTKAASLWTS